MNCRSTRVSNALTEDKFDQKSSTFGLLVCMSEAMEYHGCTTIAWTASIRYDRATAAE